MWSVECGVWSVSVVWSVECGVQSVECGVRSGKCSVEGKVKCGVWSVCVCAYRERERVEVQVWSVKCGV